MITLLALLAASFLGLYLVVRGATTANPLGVGGNPWRDLWTVEGEVDRGPYLFYGFSLMALKFNLERAVAGILYDRSWSVLAHYLHAPSYDLATLNKGTDAPFFRLMLLMSVPFIWTGVALTVRRLRSAGLPAVLAAVFFVPVINLFFFLLMAALPAATREEKGGDWLDRFIPRSDTGCAVMVVGVSGALALLMARFSTYLIKGYGWGLFIGLPFVMGLIASLLYGHRVRRTLAECIGVSFLSVTFGGVVLFAAAVEGVICLAMAAPIGYGLALMGAILGWMIQSVSHGHRGPAVILVILGVPALMGAEELEDGRLPAEPVSTAVEIDAPPSAVWRNVVEFSELPAPTHPIFKLGFAYPIRATIKGRGVGAVRHCEFTTGPFVEPITVWDEPRLLKFAVTSQPSPMKESSWYPDIHPAHLDGFLVSEGGQFALEELPGGRTKLTGTTWYRHEIKPVWYWRPFSDAIITRIHARVLAHVKALSEKKA